jgi:hypothetical protein
MPKRSSGEDALIAVTATMEEWRDLERLITSYRQQCRAMRRFTAQSGLKSPDDYFI